MTCHLRSQSLGTTCQAFVPHHPNGSIGSQSVSGVLSRHFDCSGGAKANINPGALSTTRISGRAQNGDDASPAPCCLRVISRRSVYPSPATISTTLESVAVEEDYLIVGRMCCTSLYGSSG